MVFCLLSLGAGFYIPRALGVELAIPAAVYSMVMFPVAAIVGSLISRSHVTRMSGGAHKKAGGIRRSHELIATQQRRGPRERLHEVDGFAGLAITDADPPR